MEEKLNSLSCDELQRLKDIEFWKNDFPELNSYKMPQEYFFYSEDEHYFYRIRYERLNKVRDIKLERMRHRAKFQGPFLLKGAL